LQNLVDQKYFRAATTALKEYYSEGDKICTQILFNFMTTNNDFVEVWKLYSTHGRVSIGQPTYYSYYELEGIIENERLRQSKTAEVS
jgi:hypothetical protein